MNDRVKLAFCWLVGTGWLASLIVGMIPAAHYNPPLAIHGPMMAVIGAVFATRKGDEK